MSKRFLEMAQTIALSFEGKRDNYQTAQMGNALRWAANDIKSVFEAKVDLIITDAVTYLSEVIRMEDAMLILDRQDVFAKSMAKGQ